MSSIARALPACARSCRLIRIRTDELRGPLLQWCYKYFRAQYQEPHDYSVCPVVDIDGVDPFGIKRQILADCRDSGIRSLVAPYGIGRTPSTCRDAEIGGLSLVGTVGP